MPTWFPWIVVGGAVFMALSFVAAKYKGVPHTGKAFVQDFLSGGVVIALLGVLVPDVFPDFPLSVPSSSEVSTTMKGLLSGTGSDDVELQLGPLGR
jgi:hypothetical protein